MMCCEWCSCTADCDECKRRRCEEQAKRRRHYAKHPVMDETPQEQEVEADE